jgi:hypothetical protein
MTEQERGLKINYEAIRSVLVWSAPFWAYRMDEIWEVVKSTFPDSNSKCKCVDHKLDGAGPYWRPPLNLLSSKEWATAVHVKFNYCPECGRKLQPNETR